MSLWNKGWSGEKIVERVLNISLTDKVPEDPDSLEHVDAVENQDEDSVLSAVEDQRWCDLQIPVKPHHEEQT